jgi:hypothetical protein
MKAAGFTVIIERDCWKAARAAPNDVEIRTVPISDEEDAPATADLIAAELKNMGYRGGGICMALGSDFVLTDQVDCGNLPRKDRAAAMIFRFEEQLPLAAEQFTAAFGPPIGAQVLGVAVQTDDIQAIVDQLTEAGVETASICPAAMLAMWRFRNAGPPSDYVILAGENRAEIFRTANNRQPVTWSTSATRPEQLLAALGADMLAVSLVNTRPTLRLLGPLSHESAAALNADECLEVVHADQTPIDQAAALGGADILAGKPAGWVDLRCGDLAPPNPWKRLSGLANLAAMLAVLLVAASAAMLHWRSVQYDSIATQRRGQQRDQYATLYPGRRAPVSVTSALKSELKRLSGISGGGDRIPLQANALNMLHSIVAALPPTIRLRIIDIRITHNSIFIEGQVRDHTGAQLVCQAIRHAGFEMDPPRTEHLSRGGVAFTLTGKPKLADPQIASAKGGPR